MYQQIPLVSSNQDLQFNLRIDGVNKTFRIVIRWNKTANYWVMKLIYAATSTTLIDSLPLVTGEVNTLSLNILRGFEYLGIGKAFLIPKTTKPTTDYPNEINLGSEFVLLWDGGT